MYLYNSRRNPKQIWVSWWMFLLRSQLVFPLGNCRGAYAQCTNQDDRQGKNRPLFWLRFTMASRRVLVALLSLALWALVFSLAKEAHSFSALSQQQLTCFLYARYPFTRALRSTFLECGWGGYYLWTWGCTRLEQKGRQGGVGCVQGCAEKLVFW